ncbi:hypothetical protein KVT40_006995 [Elsinoe batatas]|uniref:CCD97-like C-terminal domain-containing protein n=1 Tax=Elsinoe batatas TaxID=2601811 RepID=A0A8K0PH58_9PEZI|nr:hypothetical protein KVT40_006995 [Elsinoe batatas]
MPLFTSGSSTRTVDMLPKQMESVPSRSAESEDDRIQRLQIKTRRRRYLEIHPEYFKSGDLELADPLLYDRMVRQFQSASEREADGKRKGYSGKLEADLNRSEAKIHALSHPDPNSPLVYRRDTSGTIIAVDQNEEDRPKTQVEGLEMWREVMEQRFLRGEDPDFDYSKVDTNMEYDDREEETRRFEDEYFAKEDEEFIGEGSPAGETGVQDF